MSPKRSKSIPVFLILAFAVLLPVAPVMYSYSRARWILAYAANELIAGRTESARNALSRAMSIDSSVGVDSNYWRLQYEIIDGKVRLNEQELDDLLKQILRFFSEHDAPNQRVAIGHSLGGKLLSRGYADRAVVLMHKLFPPPAMRSSNLNNTLAYARAVADIDLDIAIKEIDLALKFTPDESAYLDTKAWILYRRKEFEPALQFANRSLDIFHQQLQNAIPELASILIPKSAAFDAQPQQPLEIPEQLIIENLKEQIATMRYHRVCILKALMREDDTQEDVEWLKRFGFNDPEKLI